VLEDFKEIYCLGENARKNEIFCFPATFILVGGSRYRDCSSGVVIFRYYDPGTVNKKGA